MKPLYNIYLLFIRSGLKNDTSFSQVVSVEEQAALAALAEEHRTIPFVLPGFRNTPFYSAMLQKTKNMMLNYYQIDAFTRHTVSLLKENGVPCILLKGISLAACYPVPEYRKLGDLDLYKDAEFFAENTTGELILPDRTYDLQTFACLLVPSSESAIFQPQRWDSDLQGLYTFVQENALNLNTETLAAMKAAGDDAQVLALSTCSTEFTDARTILLAWMIPSASDS